MARLGLDLVAVQAPVAVRGMFTKRDWKLDSWSVRFFVSAFCL